MTNTDNKCSALQRAVEEYSCRHRSVLDVLSKLQETSARVNRAVVRAVTDCGCISIDASKQTLPENCSYAELNAHLTSQVKGRFCENCREVVQEELGTTLFYMAALCNTFDLDLNAVLQEEASRLEALGHFHLR